MATCKNCGATITKNNLNVVQYKTDGKLIKSSCQKCKPLDLCKPKSIHHMGMK